MSDDFASYVIGTNSSTTNWLSLRLEEPGWQSPEERLQVLLPKLSDTERQAWEQVEAAKQVISGIRMSHWLTVIKLASEGKAPGEQVGQTVEANEDSAAVLATLGQRERALSALWSALSPEHVPDLEAILAARHKPGGQHPPYFDLSVIQRYVLWRVFDLGWTTDRFGEFDRFHIGYSGRYASKAERIGKKYQWIAYHEIMALIADHFQYRERFHDEAGDRAYIGPWQDRLRDIDPSCTLRTAPGGTSWGGHSSAWWATPRFENWEETGDRDQWVARTDNLPSVEELLKVTNPRDGSSWLNLDGYFSWDKAPPADQERYEVERRGIWYICTGYLVRQEDADAFVTWSREVDFSDRWMPEPPKLYRTFLGEHAWSAAARYFRQAYYGDPGWANPGQNCPVRVKTFATDYRAESGGFDCSIDEGFTLRLPDGDFIRGASLRWTGDAADYIDPSGKLAVTDPTAHADGPSALLVREDLLKAYLVREGLTVCWSVLGEKQVIGPGDSIDYYAMLRISGAYRYDATGLSGFLNCTPESRKADTRAT